MSLPMLLTFLRIILIPVLVGLYYWPNPVTHLFATITFILAAVTDWLDGYLARRWDQSSKLGAFLDPVADKLIVAVALVLLVSDPKIITTVLSPIAFALAAMIIIGREIVISALREWMAELGQRASVAVSMVGKIKTAMQFIAIILLLYYEPLMGVSTFRFGEISLYIAAGLTLYSMVVYLRAAWPVLRESA